MFRRILKKDLKRKKTMNIIIMLFVVICTMFTAAAANNIIAVTGGVDHYLELADMPDVVIDDMSKSGIVMEKLSAQDSVTKVKIETYLTAAGADCFKVNGRKLTNFTNVCFISSADNMMINYFDLSNDIIKTVDDDCFYGNATFVSGSDLKKGDKVEATFGEQTITLTFAGQMKDAVLGAKAQSSPRILLSGSTFDRIKDEPVLNVIFQDLYGVWTDDPEGVAKSLDNIEGVYASLGEDVKSTYLYDMIVAGVVLVISVILMITAFVMLRFTIGFTISEEFREIGVMKAVGISNAPIRRLYVIKYLAIAIAGAVIGLFCSLPLSSVMQNVTAQNIVLSSDQNVLVGVLCAIALVLVIVMFSYSCTHRIKKLSPIDAVRSGETGERVRRKGILKLGRSKLPATGFMALNDVLSAPKRFGIMAVIFTLCILMMTTLASSSTTLCSDVLLPYMGTPESDAYFAGNDVFIDVISSDDGWEKTITGFEELLAEKGMPGKCSTVIGTMYDTSYGSKNEKIGYMVVKGLEADSLVYDEGSAPMKNDEVALSHRELGKLGASIGDRVTLRIGDEPKEFIVTGSFSSFMFNGYCGILSSDTVIPHDKINLENGIQIRFDGDPDEETIEKNIKKLKEVLDSDKVFSGDEFVGEATQMSDTMRATQRLMTLITVIIVALIAVLMERSFISKEKSEIALMKAMGISSRSIIWQHTLRFVIVSAVSCILSSVVFVLTIDPVMNQLMRFVGDINGTKAAWDPLEIFGLCPLILIGTATVSVFLTALYTRTIKASDAASIE